MTLARVGEHTGAAGVEPFEPQARGGHRVEVRRLEQRMLAVAGLAPAHVVGHDQHNMRARANRFGMGTAGRGNEPADRH